GEGPAGRRRLDPDQGDRDAGEGDQDGDVREGVAGAVEDRNDGKEVSQPREPYGREPSPASGGGQRDRPRDAQQRRRSTQAHEEVAPQVLDERGGKRRAAPLLLRPGGLGPRPVPNSARP